MYRQSNWLSSAANAVNKNNPRRNAKQHWSEKGPGAKITLGSFPSEEEEARSVVERVEYARLAKRVPWSHQAILFRTNQQSRALETALRKARVSYRLIGGQSYFDRREVRDFLAYLKVFLNPHDDVSLLRIPHVPAPALHHSTLQPFIPGSHRLHTSP